MSGVLIHLPQEPATTVRLGAGEAARFGRGSDTVPVELRLTDPAVSRLAGEIRVSGDHWLLSNFSSTQSYLVENPEGAGEYLRVPPRRVGVPIPFEFARVVLPTRGSGVSFQVFAPDHVYLDPEGADEGRRGTRTLTAYSLDETATYFLVLVALCEPRLRDESALAVPTTPEIVERLRAHPQCAQLTTRAVSAQIDYLAEEKLRIQAPAAAGEAVRGGRRNGKREALVAVALRFGLVGEGHLRYLPARPAAGPGGVRTGVVCR
ncbi:MULTISPECIES: serine/threonine protein kinase [unclassified Streptomyces]|uniref:serine/threonine protein kinase n=1 Tax=unclassified Streptomyces TaxID=2593676 RepID=UPI0036E84208